VDWLCVLENEPSSENLICGDDATSARWVDRDDLQSETYSLDKIALEVIDRAVLRSEASGK
jgi:hypothetical protein